MFTTDPRTLLDAIAFLRGEGKDVTPAEGIPGLFNVDGRELTSGQVVSFAAQLATSPNPF